MSEFPAPPLRFLGWHLETDSIVAIRDANIVAIQNDSDQVKAANQIDEFSHALLAEMFRRPLYRSYRAKERSDLGPPQRRKSWFWAVTVNASHFPVLKRG
jgi:hypothetical protein